MDAPRTRVLVIDDHPDITELLCFVIGKQASMECVGCAHCVDELAADLRRYRPDVLVLDARMPGADPLQAVVDCAAEFPAVRAIFYTGYDEPAFIEKVIEAGAWGFVSKRQQADALIAAILAVAAGRPVFPGTGQRR